MDHDDSPDAGRDAGLFGREPPASSTRPRKRPPATPIQRALALLARREHSRKELTRKLIVRGLDPTEVEAAIAKLVEAGWQDDARFAESLVRSRVNGGYGPLHIRAELATHGLDSDTIAAGLDSCDDDRDWTRIARDLVHRRYGESVVDDLKLRRKAADMLMRRGFPGDIIRAATRFDPDE